MNRIKIIFFSLFFALTIFGLSGQKAAAVSGAFSGGYYGGSECWVVRASTSFTITADMLTAGDLLADYSVSANQGAVVLAFDPVITPGCCWNGSGGATNIFARIPGSGCYINGSAADSKTDFNLSDTFPAIDFSVGTTHSVYCFAWTRTNSNGGGGSCSFGVKPSCSLQASPANIQIGDTTTLSWVTSAIFTGTIDPGNINTTPIESGSKIVTPTASGVNTYTMTAHGVIDKTCTAQVTVAPPSCTLNANPGKVYSGQTTKLNWQITGAAATANASIDKGIGAVASPTGNANTPAIIGATTFTLTFTGIDTLSHSCSVTVNIFTPTVITFEKKTSIGSANELIAAIINWLLRMASSLVILFLVIGGIYYITAVGDTEKIKEGKKIITYVIIGLIIILISYTLVTTLNKIIFG